jgi:valyl-tRNA synthetase
MTKLAGKYEGQKIKEARANIIEELKSVNLLLKEEPITHAVNVHERCGTPIEFIHSKQWFIKYLDLKEDMEKWGSELNWYPEHMKNRYDNWVKGLAWDWCISRQLPYGVPFPVWYCKDCDEVILAKEEDLPVDPLSDKAPVEKCKCGCIEFIPEKDIINTWATSSLTPQIAAALVPEMYDKLYPMSLRPQAHDIITFWLFNTVVKSRLHNNVNPWKDCIISGWALDPKGKKMSKSRGNVIEPQVMLDKYGADSLRFWAAGSKLGEDLAFQEKDLFTGQKTVTKLWNASKFGIMMLKDYQPKEESSLEDFDKWLLSKLNNLVKSSTEAYDKYEYARVKLDLEKFFWHIFCDNYLELVKDRLYNPDQREGSESGKIALYKTLLNQLKMFAPIMPYITEEIYQAYFKDKEGKESIHLTSWPAYNEKFIDNEIEEIGDKLVEVISQVRKVKSENKVSLKEPVTEIVLDLEEEKVKGFLDDFKAVTKAQKVSFGKEVKVTL